MSLNRICLVGRLCAEPEMRYTQAGKAVASARIAVQRDFKNQQGEYEADFISLTFWEKQAEFVCNYLRKGNLVSIDGRLQIRQYLDKDGQKRYATEVVVNHVSGLERKADAAGATEDDGLRVPSERDDAGSVWDDQ